MIASGVSNEFKSTKPKFACESEVNEAKLNTKVAPAKV